MLAEHLGAKIDDRMIVAPNILRNHIAARVEHANIEIVTSLIADANDADILSGPQRQRPEPEAVVAMPPSTGMIAPLR